MLKNADESKTAKEMPKVTDEETRPNQKRAAKRLVRGEKRANEAKQTQKV